MEWDNTLKTFFELLRAGLWEDIRVDGLFVNGLPLTLSSSIDWLRIYDISEKQSIIGLITAGIEHNSEIKVPQEVTLQLVGTALQLECRNVAMNFFICDMVERMREVGIYGLLVKGQGLAQCYPRPLWRPCGDIDFFFSKDAYPQAVDYFLKVENAREVQNARYTKSFGVVIDSWIVELHGTLRNCLSSEMDREIDTVQDEIFRGRNVRVWMCGSTQVFLPGVDNDVFLVFTHFIRHLYKEGICLKQVCDWCRLLWTYRNTVNVLQLESRIRRAGLMSEWKSFAALAVDYLGMPVEAMPLYNADKKWQKKGRRIIRFIIEGRKGNKLQNTLILGLIFPLSTLRFLPGLFFFVNWMKLKEKLIKR